VGQGSARSFEEFFTATYGRLVGLLFAFLHDRAQAEDAVQDAFASALLRWRVLSGYHDPEAWVRAVAFRRAIATTAEAPASGGPCCGWGRRCRCRRSGLSMSTWFGPAQAPCGPAGGAGLALCGRAGRGPGRGRAAAAGRYGEEPAGPRST
jgi:hypothetical protein